MMLQVTKKVESLFKVFASPDFTHVLQFSGTWYYIQKYAEDWEVSICPGIRFTESEETGRIDILEWDVADEEADEVNATDGYLTMANPESHHARFNRTLTSRNTGENEEPSKKISINTSIYVSLGVSPIPRSHTHYY